MKKNVRTKTKKTKMKTSGNTKKKAMASNLTCHTHGKKTCGSNKLCKWDWLNSKCVYSCWKIKAKNECTKGRGCSWRGWGNCGKDFGW